VIDPNPNDDVVRRNVKRELACKLTTEDELRISKTMVVKKRELRELEADLAREKKKRQEQIDDLEDEVRRMETDLDRGAEDRTVPCNEVFRRAEDGTGWIVTIRLDTLEEVERRAASAHETQRYLPHVDIGPSNGSVLDDARAQQRAAAQRSMEPAEDDFPSDDVPDEESEAGAADLKRDEDTPRREPAKKPKARRPKPGQGAS
jgi:hypothetical protein